MNINEVPASRELDALIAEKVMGWVWVSLGSQKSIMFPNEECAKDYLPMSLEPYSFGKCGVADIEHVCFPDMPWDVPCYSTDIAAAWEAVERVLIHDKRLLQFRAEIVSGGKYQYAKFVDCSDNSAPVYGACATTMPLAICRAALKTINGKQTEMKGDH